MKSETIGGDRLGSGKKLKVQLHNYERSTHDLSHVFRTTASVGTLIPFLSQVGLPGDTFDIGLDADVKTLPTLGPLFGSFKLQLDIFKCDLRLYNGVLHNNRLGIGMKMDQVRLPQFQIELNKLNQNVNIPIENQQINQSSLLAYLGFRGGGHSDMTSFITKRNAVPYIAYYDIYKNYYVNKMEKNAYIIDNTNQNGILISSSANGSTTSNWTAAQLANAINHTVWSGGPTTWSFVGNSIEWAMFKVLITGIGMLPFRDVVQYVTSNRDSNDIVTISGIIKPEYRGKVFQQIYFEAGSILEPKPKLKAIPIANFDTLREAILKDTQLGLTFVLDKNSIAPYGTNLINWDSTNKYTASRLPQQGLAIKTYQSDIFNNWVNTEWIDGLNGITEITQVDVADGYLKLDSLNLAQKVYNMMNRIAITGGSYDDWMSAVYSHEGMRRVETPVYCGGMSEEIVFQEVVSQAETEDPLGTLAGRGTLNKKRKGGYVTVKCDEPCYIIGIVSITPRIDYSQGNSWDMRLETLDDFHKPALDGIGFQELITENMFFADTKIISNGNEVLRSAGKQPAWINYMTAVNRCYGNFADASNGGQMFMTLNRRYEFDWTTNRIKDLTTYIDPAKFNYAFAQTDLSGQNFWVQIGMQITARRKMSAKQIPNL